MNDKIFTNTKALGYCCPYGFFIANTRRSDSYQRLAEKANVSVRTIAYCKKKILEGELKCEGGVNCLLSKQIKEAQE